MSGLEADGRPGVQDAGPDTGAGSGGGCLKALGCGCLILVLGAVLLGVGAYLNREALLAFGIKQFARVIAEEQMRLPGEEVEAVMRPIGELADRVSEGEISQEEGQAILKRLVEGDEGAAVLLRGFETRYIDHEGLVPEERRGEAALAVNRFANGLLDDRIPRSALAPVGDVVLVEDAAGNPQLKEPLTAADVQQVIGILEDANAEHGVDDAYDALDLEALVRRAIDEAVAEVEAEAAAGAAP